MRREVRKAPDMNVLARHYLQLGLRDHPDIARHVPNVRDLEEMPMLKLMKLAKEMGIEPNDLIESTELEETERSRYSMRYPATVANAAAYQAAAAESQAQAARQQAINAAFPRPTTCNTYGNTTTCY